MLYNYIALSYSVINKKKLINTILYFAQNTMHCGKIKLYKLLFWADFAHFKQAGRSITGLPYETWDFGPLPKSLWNIIEEKDFAKLDNKISIDDSSGELHRVIPNGYANENIFTKREIKILEELAIYYREKKADEIIADAHIKGDPWDITKETKGYKQNIDYMLAIDGTPESISREEAEEKLIEQEEIERMLNYRG